MKKIIKKASLGFASLNKKVYKEKPGICWHQGKHLRTRAGARRLVTAGGAVGTPRMGGLSTCRDRAAVCRPAPHAPILPSSPARCPPATRSQSCLLGAAVAAVAQRVGRAAGVQHLDPQGVDGPH